MVAILCQQDLAYCSFQTPKLVISRNEARRDASARLAKFGLTKQQANGKTALDLGCNVGAMLFELNNLGIHSGLGIEYDVDKVDLAKQIAQLSNISNLHFRQGDIDLIEPEAIGMFDIVLALAIESHVQNKTHLYKLLGKATKSTLLFEGNSNCDIKKSIELLHNNGFKFIEYIGMCDDDSVSEHNKRQLLIAKK